MKLSQEQLTTYENDGLLLFPGFFEAEEVAAMQAETERLMTTDVPGLVFEQDDKTVRALHGCHLYSDFFDRLVRHPRMLELGRRLVDDDVYVHQFKINVKAAFGGDVWPWHQDYVFWLKEDGMPTPRVTNLAIFLDEVNEFNGPLCLIPGSHRGGVVDVPPTGGAASAKQDDWTANFSAKLKYTLEQETIAEWVEDRGIVAPKGPAGSLLIFDSNMAHGSVPNISPFDRKLLIVTYNSVQNQPTFPGEPRPEYLVGHDFTPLQPVENHRLA